MIRTHVLMRKTTAAAAILGAAILTAPPASAEKIAAVAARVAKDNGTQTGFFKGLDGPGDTALQFRTTVANQLVKITFNAECAAIGPVGAYVSVTILVDGIEANPQAGQDFIFCSAASTSQFVVQTAAVRQSWIRVPSPVPTHAVRVLVNRNAGATHWLLGNMSTIVEIE